MFIMLLSIPFGVFALNTDELFYDDFRNPDDSSINHKKINNFIQPFMINDSFSKVISVHTKYIKVLEYFNENDFNEYYELENSFLGRVGQKHKLYPIKVEEIELTKEQYELESANKMSPISISFKADVHSGEIGTAKVNTAYKTLQTVILKLGNGQFRVRSDLVWTQMPINRDEDLLTTEVGSNVVPNDNTKYGKQLWTMCANSSDCIEGQQAYSSSSSKWVNPDFYSRTLKPNLKNDEIVGLKNYKVTFLWIYMYYDLSKDYNGTINVLDAYGRYKHRRADGYDSMPNTHAQATDVNW